MIVVADTTPLNYLFLLGHIDILPALYTRIAIPVAVQRELLSPRAPLAVRSWITTAPDWMEIVAVKKQTDCMLDTLDAGEREAILLAETIQAGHIIIDEREGRRIAQQRGLKVIGTLGVLRDAARSEMLDLPYTLRRLQEAGFYVSKQVLESVLRDAR